jgi:hypothetical protein
MTGVVPFTDSEGLKHAVEVLRGVGLRSGRKGAPEFSPQRIRGPVIWPATRLTSLGKQPESEHTVSVGNLESWLDGGSKSPNEQLPEIKAEGDSAQVDPRVSLAIHCFGPFQKAYASTQARRANP